MEHPKAIVKVVRDEIYESDVKRVVLIFLLFVSLLIYTNSMQYLMFSMTP